MAEDKGSHGFLSSFLPHESYDQLPIDLPREDEVLMKGFVFNLDIINPKVQRMILYPEEIEFRSFKRGKLQNTIPLRTVLGVTTGSKKSQKSRSRLKLLVYKGKKYMGMSPVTKQYRLECPTPAVCDEWMAAIKDAMSSPMKKQAIQIPEEYQSPRRENEGTTRPRRVSDPGTPTTSRRNAGSAPEGTSFILRRSSRNRGPLPQPRTPPKRSTAGRGRLRSTTNDKCPWCR